MIYPGSTSVSQALLAEQSALLRLKLPVPKLVALPLIPRQPFPNPASRFRYQIPPHAAFTVRLPGEAQSICYFIRGEAALLADAESDFAAYGLCAVAYTYPGLWLNRDPYLAYKSIQSEQRLPGLVDLPPLKKIVGLPVSRLQASETPTELFAGLTEGCLDIGDISDYSYPQPPLASEFTLSRLALRREQVTIKLVHSPQSRPVSSRHFLEQLRGLKQPLVFSLIVEPQATGFQLSFAPEDQVTIERQLKLYFPTLSVIPVDNPVDTTHQTTLYGSVSRPRYAYLPLRTDLHLNPYSQVLAALAAGQQDHQATVEVIFQPLAQSIITRLADQLAAYRERLNHYAERKATEAADYRKENERYFGEWPRWSNDPKDYEKQYDEYREWLERYGKKVAEVQRTYESFVEQNPPLVQAAREQMAKLGERLGWLHKKIPSWLAAVRITSSSRRLLEQVQSTFLRQFETLQQRWQRTPSRAFSKLPEWLPKQSLLNTDELAGLINFPSNAIRDPRLETTANTTTTPPALYTQAGIRLGTAQALGTSYNITLPDQVRDRHVYVIGRTRSGKSTLLFNMILQDILRGAGVGVIDPHGDLVQKLLEYIPEERIRDTIYLKPVQIKVL